MTVLSDLFPRELMYAYWNRSLKVCLTLWVLYGCKKSSSMQGSGETNPHHRQLK